MKLKVFVPKNYYYFFRLTLIFFLIQSIVRLLLVIQEPPSIIESLDILLDGLLWDVYAWAFLFLPLFLIFTIFPSRVILSFERSLLSKIITFILTAFWIFVGICELNFWNEFHSRFNFIAVDYLIYTNEVLANIKESFPVGWILLAIAVTTLFLNWMVMKISFISQEKMLLNKRVGLTLFGVVIPVIFFSVIGPVLETHDENFREDQLSRNGWVEFVRAFRSNKIDYQAFYQTIPKEKAEELIKSKKMPLSPMHSPFPSKPNVLLIVVESLGAKFISPLGGQKETTPFLNGLAEESIFFENLYSTGTRTVRGLEAINLSLPPTPGYAVVKRPDHKNLYSMGKTFSGNGYDPIFLYGGRGFFDNMNSFFQGNGFSVIDQGDFLKKEITFTNAWGVCDEDLFSKATQILDSKTSARPTLLFMLTTSNHRPFTYPEGKIDIPSGESRAGAVKYTDYAIGKFIKSIKNKAWMKNTLVVVIADHSTEGRGHFDLEMSDFHIPLWIYAPQNLKPQKMTKLASQIDLLPSLIHLLNLKDTSPFFGQSFFNKNFTEERAFIGNYQYVGYYKNNILTTLGPNRTIRSFSYDPISKSQVDHPTTPFLDEAVSYYQYASDLLSHGKYKAK
jgi:phosphoglycerol transferase MdoB-like AlkP superfamily enzyme